MLNILRVMLKPIVLLNSLDNQNYFDYRVPKWVYILRPGFFRKICVEGGTSNTIKHACGEPGTPSAQADIAEKLWREKKKVQTMIHLLKNKKEFLNKFEIMCGNILIFFS